MIGIETALRLVGGVVLLLANGFFVTTEFAMTRVPQFDAADLRGSDGLDRALEMVEELEIYLSGCQVGITFASVGLGFVAEPAVSAVVDRGLTSAGVVAAGGEGHGVLSVAIALGMVNLAHVVVGEQAPTYLGVERSKLVAKYCAPPLYYWTRLMSPVIRVADWTAKALLGLFGVTISRSWTEEESEAEVTSTPVEAASDGEGVDRGALRREMGEVLSRGSVSLERREEVMNALRIGETPVRSVMVPKASMKALSTADDPAESLATMERNPQHSRFPLFEGDPADPAASEFVGVVYLPTVLPHVDALRAGDQQLRDIAAPPMTVEADLPVAELIDRFQAENQELAVVLDDREVVGVVTATDAFEAIAGDLEDPLDAAAA